MSTTATRYTFKKTERLCSRKQIEQLIQTKQHKFSHPLKLMYALNQQNDAKERAQVAFVVPKRLFKKANQRNYIKRLMREAYRINKPEFYKQLEQKQNAYNLMFVYAVADSPNFNDIKKKIVLLLQQLP
ncbi:MAG: ribonuclease P protein component [Bacteroidia bacterium]|mgnify:CR=1 FL=1|nr:ribonuclease P protein component [Bacteroidia bacterium]HQV00140.1 ribonuclease P protein component [Bacteroidia bacterium]